MSVHMCATDMTPALRRIYNMMTQDIQDKKERDRRFGKECVGLTMHITMENLKRSLDKGYGEGDFAYIVYSTDMPNIDPEAFRDGFAQETTRYADAPMPTVWDLDYRVHAPSGKGLLHIGLSSAPHLHCPALARLEETIGDVPDWHRILLDDLAREAYHRAPPPVLLTKPKKGKTKKGK